MNTIIKNTNNCRKLILFSALISLTILCFSQTGSEKEPVRFVGGVTIDPSVHEGRLRYAIGTESRQTLRVNRSHSEWAEGSGWTYNHASNLCYWNGKFYQQYLSNPVDKHIEPGQTLITTSVDGRNWEKPHVVFPPYVAPKGVKIPNDCARAIRVFKESNNAEIELEVFPKQKDHGILEIDVTDRYGNRPVRLRFDDDGKIKAENGGEVVSLENYEVEKWYKINQLIDAKPYGNYSLWINDIQKLKEARLAEAVKSVERISFRTGPYRDIPNRKTPNETPGPPLPGADEPVKMAQFYIDDIISKSIK